MVTLRQKTGPGNMPDPVFFVWMRLKTTFLEHGTPGRRAARDNRINRRCGTGVSWSVGPSGPRRRALLITPGLISAVSINIGECGRGERVVRPDPNPV